MIAETWLSSGGTTPPLAFLQPYKSDGTLHGTSAPLPPRHGVHRLLHYSAVRLPTQKTRPVHTEHTGGRRLEGFFLLYHLWVIFCCFPFKTVDRFFFFLRYLRQTDWNFFDPVPLFPPVSGSELCVCVFTVHCRASV